MSWLVIIGMSWLVASVVVGLVVGRAIGEDERRAAFDSRAGWGAADGDRLYPTVAATYE
jgi:hypothetical protein